MSPNSQKTGALLSQWDVNTAPRVPLMLLFYMGFNTLRAIFIAADGEPRTASDLCATASDLCATASDLCATASDLCATASDLCATASDLCELIDKNEA